MVIIIIGFKRIGRFNLTWLCLYHTSLPAILQFHHIRAMLCKIPQWQLFISDFTSKHRNLIDQGSDTALSEALSLLLDEATLHYRDLHRTSSEVDKKAYYDACVQAFGKQPKSQSLALAFATATLECDHYNGAHKTKDCRAKHFDRKKYLSSLPACARIIYEFHHHRYPD
eukprot:190439-Hanusia_phi.AAC.1